MEFSLELMAIISSNGIDSEWEFSDNIIHEINRILLCMPLINFQSANSRCVINGGILETPDFLTFFNFKIKKLHINLYMMSRHLFFITNCRNRSFSLTVWQAIQVVAL